MKRINDFTEEAKVCLISIAIVGAWAFGYFLGVRNNKPVSATINEQTKYITIETKNGNYYFLKKQEDDNYLEVSESLKQR